MLKIPPSEKRPGGGRKVLTAGTEGEEEEDGDGVDV